MYVRILQSSLEDPASSIGYAPSSSLRASLRRDGIGSDALLRVRACKDRQKRARARAKCVGNSQSCMASFVRASCVLQRSSDERSSSAASSANFQLRRAVGVAGSDDDTTGNARI